MGDFLNKWARNADKKETTSDWDSRNWVSLIFPLFFRSDNSILMGIKELTSVVLLWKEESLILALENEKQVFANFPLSKKVDVNGQIMLSNDWATNGSIDFPVWYSKGNLFDSEAVLDCRFQMVATFTFSWLFWFWEFHPMINCFHNVFLNVNGSFCYNFVFRPSGGTHCKGYASLLETFS